MEFYGTTYAFVDGNYFFEVVKEELDGIYADEPVINIDAVRSELRAIKLFFYDALAELPELVVTPEDIDKVAKIKAREAIHKMFNQTDGIHVREGSVRQGSRRGKPRAEQKEVDVYLAVEALSFAYRGVIQNAILFAGDSDFIPLVEDLVKLGITVIVASGRSPHVRLIEAADSHWQFDYDLVYRSMGDEWRQKNHMVISNPAVFQAHTQPGWTLTTTKIGSLPTGEFEVYQSGNNVLLTVRGQPGTWQCDDVPLLKRYLEKNEGATFL